MRLVSAWIVTTACVLALFWAALTRLEVDSDVSSILPSGDPVVRDAQFVFAEHPALERIFIDIHLVTGDRKLLIASAQRLERRLRESGFFRSVGLPRVEDSVAHLYSDIAGRLPTLFSRNDLLRDVRPRLRGEWITRHLSELRETLAGLDGFGAADLIAKDPLSLRDLVMARLAPLRPGRDITLEAGVPISGDHRHALVLAVPARPGFDTDQARRVIRLLASAESELQTAAKESANTLRLTMVGGMRAALDNERVIRKDTQRALLIASAGIFVLVLLGFPRPHIGLLSLIPAVAGTAVSLFVYSLLYPRVSALSLGFGGALISITVDHGLTFLLFYVGARRNAGKQAARQLWSVGLLAALTTMTAFLLLPLAGFPLLTQVGLIAGVGVGASFLFIHLVFPWLLPKSRRVMGRSLLPLPSWLRRLGRLRPAALWTLVLASLLLALMARPRFQVDLKAMNGVTAETLEAEAHVQKVWGAMEHPLSVILESHSLESLRADADRLAALLDRERQDGRIREGFSPSQIVPGPARAKENLAAWRAFWSEERRRDLERELRQAGEATGFDARAFAPFLDQVGDPGADAPPMPEDLWPLFGITRSERSGRLLALAPIALAEGARSQDLIPRIRGQGFRVLDPERLPERLATLLAESFAWMLGLVGAGVLLLLILLLLDWRLILVALAPLGFSAACTAGVLTLLNHPLDLGGIMLAIVVLGLGLDYGLYLLRAFQQSPSEALEIHGPVRTAVFLSGGTTLLGFSSLLLSGHPLLRSVGITVTLGLGFALLGALVLVPPLLRRLLAPLGPGTGPMPAHDRDHLRLVSRAYRHLPPYPRLFTWFKLRLDPMFHTLRQWLPERGVVLDVGCGYGVPSAWALTLHPELRIVGMEPDGRRAQVAKSVLGSRGAAVRCLAPDLPLSANAADAVLFVDVAHYLDDDALAVTLARLARLLRPGGRLIMRTTVPREGRTPMLRRFEEARLRLARRAPHYRSARDLSAALEAAGFAPPEMRPESHGREEVWFVATPRPGQGGQGA